MEAPPALIVQGKRRSVAGYNGLDIVVNDSIVTKVESQGALSSKSRFMFDEVKYQCEKPSLMKQLTEMRRVLTDSDEEKGVVVATAQKAGLKRTFSITYSDSEVLEAQNPNYMLKSTRLIGTTYAVFRLDDGGQEIQIGILDRDDKMSRSCTLTLTVDDVPMQLCVYMLYVAFMQLKEEAGGAAGAGGGAGCVIA